MPLVDGEKAVGGNGDDGGHHQARLGVGSNVSNGRVGRELQHHYDVLLHLLCEHQRGLQEKILFRPAGRDRGGLGGEGRAGGATADESKREKKKSGEAAVGVSGDRREEEEGEGQTES